MIRSLVTMMVILFLIFPTLAAAETDVIVTRLAGYDRYETAAQIAKAGWERSDYAVLAYGRNYPDALAATPLACKYDAPILLTESDRLPEITRDTLLWLQVRNVIIVGGTGVIFASVDAELQEMYINTRRVYGYDKYETAVEIAREFYNPAEIFVVTGEDFTDALSVAAVAGIKQAPILLVPQDEIPGMVKDYIDAQRISKSYVVGDSQTISDQVFRQFPNAERNSGMTNYRTNLVVNLRFIYADLFKSEYICLASGELFADALTGSAYAAKISAPVILINNDPATLTNEFAIRWAEEGYRFYVFGGTGILSERVVQPLLDAAPKPEEKRELDVEAFKEGVLRLTNVERVKEGLRPLARGSAALEQAAEKRAEEAIDVWDHIRPNGESCFTVLEEYGVIDYYMAGENLYMGSIGTPEDAVEAWMESESHKEAILTPEFTHLGVGVVMDEIGIVYAAQLFLWK